MKTWKVGIVGLSRGRGFVNVFSAHPRVEVAALCDVDEKKLAQVGEAFGLADSRLYGTFDDFLNAPMDIVMIATPIPFHAEQTIRSLESGKHVLCEQTAAYTLEDCEAIVNAVKRTGLSYMMAENYCYFHYIRQWKEMISRGRLGKIFYAEAEYVHKIVHLLKDGETGSTFWRIDRPPIWYCAHCLGPALMLMDDRVVQATGTQCGFNTYPDQSDRPGFLDMEVGLFRTEKGATIKILRSQTANRPHIVFYSLYGTKGWIESSRRPGGEGLVYVEGETEDAKGDFITCPIGDPDAPEEAGRGGHGTSEYYMIRDFLDSIEAGVRPPIDVMRAMDFTVPGILAHQAAMGKGEWLDVPAFEW